MNLRVRRVTGVSAILKFVDGGTIGGAGRCCRSVVGHKFATILEHSVAVAVVGLADVVR